MKKIACLGPFLLLSACGGPHEPPVPSLDPHQAAELLHFNNKAEAWLTYVKKQNPTCTYGIALPDQSAHPTEVDLEHAVSCGGRRSPRELDATVVFIYDKAAQKWTVGRFAS